MSDRRELQERLAKFICKEIMDDDWKLGRKICMSWADEIIEMVRLAPSPPKPSSS